MSDALKVAVIGASGIGQHHARAEHQPADRSPRKALRRSELPGLAGAEQALPADQHGAGDGRGEDDEPDRQLAADVAAGKFYRSGAQAEAALLSKSAEKRTDDCAADHQREFVAKSVRQECQVHDMSPQPHVTGRRDPGVDLGQDKDKYSYK
mgnify:CR=1 FL=1